MQDLGSMHYGNALLFNVPIYLRPCNSNSQPASLAFDMSQTTVQYPVLCIVSTERNSSNASQYDLVKNYKPVGLL